MVVMSKLRDFFLKYNKPTAITSQKCEARDDLFIDPLNTLSSEGLQYILDALTEEDKDAIKKIAQELIKVQNISDVPKGFSGLIDYLETGRRSSAWKDDSIVI